MRKIPLSAGHISSIIVTMLVIHAEVSRADATTNFQARCNAEGVIVCEGFDQTSTFVPVTTNWADGVTISSDGVLRIARDISTKMSGTSSLRFDIPSGDQASHNPGWFLKSFGQGFGENSTFYVQFAERVDQNIVNLPEGNWKQINIFGDSNTCQQVELTTEATAHGYPILYSGCGATAMYTTDIVNFNYWNNATGAQNIYHQQGTSASDGYNCKYGDPVAGTGNGVGCFMYPANTWVTYYYKFEIGRWGQPNSTLQAWVSVSREPYKQWINVHNVPLYAGDGNYERLYLSPYMSNGNPIHPTGSLWYDELIVSTQPISAPSIAKVIAAPGELRVDH